VSLGVDPGIWCVDHKGPVDPKAANLTRARREPDSLLLLTSREPRENLEVSAVASSDPRGSYLVRKRSGSPTFLPRQQPFRSLAAEWLLPEEHWFQTLFFGRACCPRVRPPRSPERGWRPTSGPVASIANDRTGATRRESDPSEAGA
jgi:hypothetical protein